MLGRIPQGLELDLRLLNRVETIKTLLQGSAESGGTGSTSSNSADLSGLLDRKSVV